MPWSTVTCPLDPAKTVRTGNFEDAGTGTRIIDERSPLHSIGI